MTIKGAIFDLDGTLLDSMSIWDDICCGYAAKNGLVMNEEILEILKPMTLQQAAEYLTGRYPFGKTARQVTEEINRLLERCYFYEVKLKDGVEALLHNFKQRGIKMNVATATDRYLAKEVLKRSGILHYFTEITTCFEVGKGKEYADIYLRSLSFLGLQKTEVLVFEDSLHAIKTAKNAGFHTVGVYDPSSELQQTQIRGICDIYLSSFKEADSILNRAGIQTAL